MEFRKHYKKTPEEYVGEELREIKELMKKDDYTESEDYCEPLAIDEIKTYSICVGFGGPSIFWEIDTKQGEVVGGRWLYGWWGDDETVRLTQEEAETVANYYVLAID